MKTLAGFVLLIILLLAGLRAQQWARTVRASADSRCIELQAQLDATEARYVGYWPRFERMEDALDVASNALGVATADLVAERVANKPLREQVEALSGERVAQAARETDLRKRVETAQSEAAQLKGSVEDVQARRVAAEEMRKSVEETVKALEEGIRSRDADLALMREKNDKLTAEFNRLNEANKAVAELQNQLAAAKTGLDEANKAMADQQAQVAAAKTGLDAANKSVADLQTQLVATQTELGEAVAARQKAEAQLKGQPTASAPPAVQPAP